MKQQHRHTPLVLALILAAGALSACGPKPTEGQLGSATIKPPEAKAALTVSLVQATAESWPQRIAAAGDVAAWQESIVGLEVGGQRIAKVLVNVGDSVKKGQTLAQLNTDSLVLDIQAAEATLAEAKATEAQALSTLERSKRLATAGGVSEQDLNQQETANQTAKARVLSAQAQLSNQKLKLQRATLVAPDTGLISSRTAAEGAIAQAGAELFRIIRQSRLEWRAEVAADKLHLVVPGQAVQVTTAKGNVLKGTVRQVAPAVNVASRMGLVYVDLPADKSLKAGMHVSGQLIGPSSPAVTVPLSAVSWRDGKSYVLQVKDKKVEALAVELGRSTEKHIEVLSGLDADTAVIEQGGAFLKTGDIVQVASSAGQEGGK